MKIGIVSGFFNPLHFGHLEYLKAAKKNNDSLIVIVNSDKQVLLKKSIKFFNENHRKVILESIKYVDNVLVCIDEDSSVCNTLCEIKKRYPNDIITFYNSGDRTTANANSKEILIAKAIGINYEYLPFPKIFSSTRILLSIIK